MIHKGEEILAAIIGGSKCGKTTLAIALVAMLWRRHRLRTIVFDPFYWEHDWGKTAWVTGDLTRFKAAVGGTQGCAVVWDESSTSMRKSSMEDAGFFTNLRHRHRAFFVLGHDFTVLSPMMRGNLSEAYVFRQSVTKARDWSELFADEDMMQAATLRQREFIHKVAFRPAVRRCPSLAELQRL